MNTYAYAINVCATPQQIEYKLFASHGSFPSLKAIYIKSQFGNQKLYNQVRTHKHNINNSTRGTLIMFIITTFIVI